MPTKPSRHTRATSADTRATPADTRSSASASTSLVPSSDANRQFPTLDRMEQDMPRLTGAARTARLRDLADAFDRCGRGVWAWDARPGHHAPLLDSTGAPLRLLASCNHRLCPRCAPRRMAKFAKRVVALAGKAFDGPGVHVTLTREALPGETPWAIADAVLDAFHRLRRMAIWKSAVQGAVAYLHFAGAAGRHVHLHALVDAQWLDQADLLVAWRKRLKPPRSRVPAPGGGVHVERADSDEAVLRYFLRAQDAEVFADADLPGMLAWLPSRRLVSTIGNLRGKRISELRPTTAPEPGKLPRSWTNRGGRNAATGEWVAAHAVTWQASESAHRIGYGLLQPNRRAVSGPSQALPDHVNRGGSDGG